MIPNQLVDFGPLAFGGVFAVLALLSLFGLVPIVVIVANRAEPDSRGMRPFTVYRMGMAFFTLLLAYAGLTLVVTALLSFIGPHYAPIGNSVAREVVIGGLLILIAGGTMYRHLRQGLALARGDGRVDGPNSRVLHSYIGVVSFVFTVAAMLSLGVAIYMLFELIGPGVFGGGGSSTGARVEVLLDFVYVLVASLAIVGYHRRQAPSAAWQVALPAPPAA